MPICHQEAGQLQQKFHEPDSADKTVLRFGFDDSHFFFVLLK